MTCQKPNQKDRKPTFPPFAKARKRVEMLFSQIVDQFMLCRNYAKQQVGLFARVISKVSALTVRHTLTVLTTNLLEESNMRYFNSAKGVLLFFAFARLSDFSGGLYLSASAFANSCFKLLIF